MTEKLFDLQDNIIILTDLNTIEYANKAFFRFFSEFNTLEDFNEKVKDISLFFKKINQYGFIFKDMVNEPWNEKNFEWYEYVIFSSDKICKVFIKESIFSIRISIYNEKQYIITLSDISELVNFKNDLLYELECKNEELLKVNTSLEDRLQDKVNELQKVNKELKRAIQDKVEENIQKDSVLAQQSKIEIMSEMIGMLSHQWKQPLTAISAYVQTLKMKQEKGKLTDDYINKATTDIVSLTNSLAHTINDFHNFFKHSERKEDFKLEKIIRKAYSFVEYSLTQNSIAFEYKSNFNVSVHSYISKFMQILLDLLQNSQDILIARHVQNPKITVEVKIEDDLACIIFSDNGGGINDNIISTLFEPYVTTKDKYSKGIGLYMTKLILKEQLNGTIEAKNNDDGAEFIIKVPMLIENSFDINNKTFSSNDFEDLFESYNDSIENIQISAKINLLDLFVILEFLIWFEDFLKESNRLNHFRVSISNIINYLKVYDNPAKLETLEAHRDELFNILGSIGNDLKVLFYSVTENKEIYNLDKSLIASFHQLFIILNKNKKDKISQIDIF